MSNMGKYLLRKKQVKSPTTLVEVHVYQFFLILSLLTFTNFIHFIN